MQPKIEIRLKKNEKIKFLHSDLFQKIEEFLALYIFDGIFCFEFHVESSREYAVGFEKSFLLTLNLIEDKYTIQGSLDLIF